MISFDLNTLIYRPLTHVFAFVATPENDLQWQSGTLASTRILEGAMGIGARFLSVGHLMDQRIETTYEVTAFEPNRRYGFKSVVGSVVSCTLYTFEIIASATRINLSMETDAGDVFTPNHALAAKRFRKQYKENLALLKSILEGHRKPGT